MDAVAALPPGGGLIGEACAALGLSRVSFHRRTATARRPPAPIRPRPRPARALAVAERQARVGTKQGEGPWGRNSGRGHAPFA